MASTTSPARPSARAESQPTLIRGLSLLDTILLLGSGIIGSSIFLTAWTLNTIFTRPHEALAGAAIVLIGVPGYLSWKRSGATAH
jgi:hypothetical protein